MNSAPDPSAAHKHAQIDWPRLAAILLCTAFALAALWLLGRYIIAILLPFVLAWAVSCLIRPAAAWLSRRTRIPHKICAAVLTVLTLAVAGWLAVQAANRAFVELGRLIQGLTADGAQLTRFVEQILATFENWTERVPVLNQLSEIPQLSGLWAQLEEVALRVVREAAVALSSKVSSAALSFVTSLPTILLSLLAFVLSCYYFGADGERMEKGIVALLPERWQVGWPEAKARGGRMMKRYVRAYALLVLLTFAEMFIGFSVLGVSYAFLLAVIVALVDLLPVFGTGTILVPWAVVALMLKQYPLGSGLLILYGISLIVRQIAEPRLVGASLGLHPLVSFAAMFAGFRLFGIAGLLLGPAVVMLVKAVLRFVKPTAAASRDEKTATEP